MSVPSTADGPWRVVEVHLGDPDVLDPRAFGLPDATLSVTGTHRPRLRLAVAPQPLPSSKRDVSITVQVSYDDTHEPIAGRYVDVTDDVPGLCPLCSGRTDAKGRLVRPLRLADVRSVVARTWINAAGFNARNPAYSVLRVPIVVRPALSASPARDGAASGTAVDVTGRAAALTVPAWDFTPRIRLELQRLRGRHWRPVSAGSIRANGRFTLVASPPKGVNLYRVALPAQQGLAAARSRTFVIRGT